MKVYYIFLLCIFSGLYSSGQKINLSIDEKSNLRNHALDNVRQFEAVLNEIISSNNPEEKEIIITNSYESIIDSTANLEDDLNPDKTEKGTSDFINVKSYLERLPLVFSIDSSKKKIKFSNILIGNVHQDEYIYLDVYFECTFNGKHKVNGKRYKKTQRLATIKCYIEEDKVVTRIINIKFSDEDQKLKLKGEAEKIEKEIVKYKESSSKKALLAEQEYKAFITQADGYFSEMKYELAKVNYFNALRVKPEDPYSIDKITKINQIQLKEEQEMRFRELKSAGNNYFTYKKYEEAKERYELALVIKPDDIEILEKMQRINKKLNPRFPFKSTAYFALNYTFNTTSIKQGESNTDFSKSFNKDVKLEHFGISFYYPVGFYLSGLKIYNDKIPTNYYSAEEVTSVANQMQTAGQSFTPLKFDRNSKKALGFDAGIYLSFCKPLFFKFGLSHWAGNDWKLYSGNYNGKIKTSDPNSGLYALDFTTFSNTSYQFGLAVVFPVVQVEGTYDNLNSSFLLSAGLNIPVRNIYFLKHNPKKGTGKNNNRSNSTTKVTKKTDNTYIKSGYLGVSYDFFNYYPSVDGKFQFNRLTDSSYTAPIIEKFSFSYFKRLGFFFSGYKKTNNQVPDYYYDWSLITQKMEYMNSQGIQYTDLKFIESQSNYKKYNLGISLCFFKPVHFKFGASFAFGSTWDIYSGDLKGYINKVNGSNYYAINYSKKIDSKFVGGIAFVFPYYQFEFMYDGFSRKYTLAAGLNIPIAK